MPISSKLQNSIQLNNLLISKKRNKKCDICHPRENNLNFPNKLL